jgi:hypothetical protein
LEGKKRGRPFTLTLVNFKTCTPHHIQAVESSVVCAPKRNYMHFESKPETGAKFKSRDFHNVPTPKKIFSGKLRLRVTLYIRARKL